MPRHVMKAIRTGAVAAAVAAAPAALAEPVVLSTLDGGFSVSGEIVAFDGQNYTISTSVGDITVAADLVTCEGADCPAVASAETMAEVVVAGDRTMSLRLMPALLRAYAASTAAQVATREAGGERMILDATGGDAGNGIALTILPTSSSAGLEALFRGQAQLALSSRPARQREVRAFQEFELGALRSAAQETVIGLDGLVLVTHPENPVRSISVADAGRVFAGQIANWAELGGPDAPINLYLAVGGASDDEALQQILGPVGATLAGTATRLGSDAAVSDAVQADPNGIGITGFLGIGAAQPLAVGGECGLETPPTEFSIKTEEYPLTRMLYMYQTNAPFPELAAGFRAFIETEEAQRLVAQAGYIDQAITLETINVQGLRVATAVLNNTEPAQLDLLRDMVGELVSADRLSTTFRFETGSSRLNARAQADVRRLAAVLAGDRFAAKEVLFVGFTDAVGDAELNRQLSQARAEQVLTEVLQANPALASTVRMNALGYGEISPLGCDESTEGRLVNRRVEVWVRDVSSVEG